MNVELTDLRYFFHVASARSFVEGAKRANVTAPAVSKAVKRLENQLGVQLLTRTTRRVSLTEAGAVVLAHCRRVLETLEDLSADLNDDVSQIRGELRIGAPEALAAFGLPAALARLSQRAPQLITRSFVMAPSTMREHLLEGTIDLGLCVGAFQSSDITVRPLVESRVSLVCGRGHPLFERARATAEELRQYPFVALQRFAASHLPPHDLFPESRYPRHVAATTDRLATAAQMVKTGAFVGYLPDISVRSELDADLIRRIEGLDLRDRVEVSVLTAAGQPLRPAVRALTADLKITLREAMAVVCAA